MSILSFLLGCILGSICSVSVGLFLLMNYGAGAGAGADQKQSSSSSSSKSEIKTTTKPKEKEPTEEELQVLNEALKMLRGEIEEIPKPETHPSEEQAPTEIRGMEAAFFLSSEESKQRQKHLKGLISFLQDFAQIHAQYSKDLKRLSTVAQGYAISNTILDKWWNSMSVALEHLSKDENLLRKTIQDDILHPMTRIELEHSHLEKQLNNEGSKLINKIKEAQLNYDLKFKEHGKYKEKTNSTSCVTLSAESTPKPTAKLHHSEASLIEGSGKLAAAQQDFNEKMPRILKDFQLITSNCISAAMERLIKFSDFLEVPIEKTSQVVHRLKMDLASSASQGTDQRNYNPVVIKLLENLANKSPQIKLDMTLESSAGLAASSMSKLPQLPPQFGDSIDKETCIWFNALAGRMYRDAARSEGFHHWFCTKGAHLLNKGKKTPLFDKYFISNPCFGSTPPLLLNVQWAPCTKQSSHSNLPTQDPEYDVECTADVAFRSSISFTVSTKLWINWPREKCAHIPISIVLELTELSGKIRFGVRKHSSFLSFVEEPFTRFNVTSEVGDQYKLKNIPKVSSLIINKLKKHIRTKLIYPGSFKLRLIWPRKWWPPGGEHLFKSETKESESTGTTTPASVLETLPTEQTSLLNSVPPTVIAPMDLKSAASKGEEVLNSAQEMPEETLFQKWFWSSTTKTQEPISEPEKPSKFINETFGPPGTLKIIDRKRMRSDNSISSPTTVRTGSVNHPDHVRLYVSELLDKDTIPNPYFLNRMAADDILIGDKSFGGGSVAIMRSRSHSISDFRHKTLVSMWAEFLGSIGHDFSLISAQSKPKIQNGSRTIHKDDIGEFRLFSLRLSSFRKDLRAQQNGKRLYPKQAPRNVPTTNNKGHFSGFGLGFLGVTSDTNILLTPPPKNRSHSRDIPEKRNGAEPEHSKLKTNESINQYYANKFGRVVDILSSVRPTVSPAKSGGNSTKDQNKEMSVAEFEQEVVNFAWQAQAEAITQAASRGEHINMQNFMRTPKLISPKSWVVMKDGHLTIYPNLPTDSELAVEKSQPTATYNLNGCICRPLEHQLGLEVGFLSQKNGKPSIDWVQFWTETDIQCRAWTMALQHCANLTTSQS